MRTLFDFTIYVITFSALYTSSDDSLDPPWKGLLHQYIPATEWLPKYTVRTQLSADLLAGVTVAVMTIPQGMAYASLAQLPPVYGLYAALVPFFLYPIFGGSKFVIMGLVAVKYVSNG